MNDYLLSLILGIVEGLTEFLPVSSTAHLRLAEWLLKIDLSSGYWKMYTIVIQLGAVLCLPIYFRHRIAKFMRTFPKGERGDRTVVTHPLTLTIIAFIVTALPAYKLTKVIGKNLENMQVIGAALLIGGVVMWIVDVLCTRRDRRLAQSMSIGAQQDPNQATAFAPNAAPTHMEYAPAEAPGTHAPTPRVEDMKLWQAVWIGAAQILSAVFPGTSRSMSTIAAGQVAGMSRASALEFSFFLSLPTMFVATIYQFLKTVILKKGDSGDPLPPVVMDTQKWIVLAIGFVVSFIVAWGVVAWFMHWVRRRGLAPFALYRIILGSAVLIYFVGWHVKI